MLIEFYGGPFDGRCSEIPDACDSILIPMSVQIAYGPAQVPMPTRGAVARYRKTDMFKMVIGSDEHGVPYLAETRRRYDFERLI